MRLSQHNEIVSTSWLAAHDLTKKKKKEIEMRQFPEHLLAHVYNFFEFFFFEFTHYCVRSVSDSSGSCKFLFLLFLCDDEPELGRYAP